MARKRVLVTEAEQQSTELTRRVDEYGQALLTRHGPSMVRLLPAEASQTKEKRWRLEFMRTTRAVDALGKPLRCPVGISAKMRMVPWVIGKLEVITDRCKIT